MAEIPTYHASIPSLATMLEDQGVKSLGLNNEISEGEQVNYANSALAREELDLLIAYNAKNPQTFNKNLVGRALVRSSMVDHLHAKALFPEVAPPAASLEAIMEQLAAMRADIGSLRQEFVEGLRDMRAQIALTNARTMNLMIRKDNMKRTTEGGLPPMPVHKVVAGSGIHKAQALRTGTGVYERHVMDIEAQIGEVPEYSEDMQHEDILQLIVFYNEDFGIERDMDLEARRKKVRLYLL